MPHCRHFKNQYLNVLMLVFIFKYYLQIDPQEHESFPICSLSEFRSLILCTAVTHEDRKKTLPPLDSLPAERERKPKHCAPPGGTGPCMESEDLFVFIHTFSTNHFDEIIVSGLC